jgi:HSP20 family molecular chaperone IbpA
MPWDPTHDLLTMQERLESLFGRAAPGWVPAVDLVEVGRATFLTVELPGMRREDVHVEGHVDSVVVSGQRRAKAVVPSAIHSSSSAVRATFRDPSGSPCRLHPRPSSQTWPTVC